MRRIAARDMQNRGGTAKCFALYPGCWGRRAFFMPAQPGEYKKEMETNDFV